MGEHKVWVIVSILALLIGGLVGSLAFPQTKEVLVKQPEPYAVPGPETVKTVTQEVQVNYTDKAISAFYDELSNDDSLLECNGHEYDSDQVTTSKLYEQWSVNYLDKDDNKYEVLFKIKLKYLDTDTQEKCYRTENVKVTFEDSEDPVITI